MLYGLGVIMLLLSIGFVGGSVVVPVAVASVGIALMVAGRRPTNEKRTRV